MNKRKEALEKINKVEKLLKQREKENWSKGERDEITKRGENAIDFYRIQFKLQVLDRMRAWVIQYGMLMKSHKHILKEYRRIK